MNKVCLKESWEMRALENWNCEEFERFVLGGLHRSQGGGFSTKCHWIPQP